MQDKLLIHDLATTCHLGVTEEERRNPQQVWISLELEIDAAKAARGDDAQAAIDYAQLVSAVKQLAESRPYNLLETMAEAVAALVLEQFHPPQIVVRVKKRALQGIEYAAVEITRTRQAGR